MLIYIDLDKVIQNWSFLEAKSRGEKKTNILKIQSGRRRRSHMMLG